MFWSEGIFFALSIIVFLFAVIVFEHTSVFPVIFDADTIDKWWRSALVFRLYHKESHGVVRFFVLCNQIFILSEAADKRC